MITEYVGSYKDEDGDDCPLLTLYISEDAVQIAQYQTWVCGLYDTREAAIAAVSADPARLDDLWKRVFAEKGEAARITLEDVRSIAAQISTPQ